MRYKSNGKSDERDELRMKRGACLFINHAVIHKIKQLGGAIIAATPPDLVLIRLNRPLFNG